MTWASVWDRVRRHGTESESNTHWTKNGMEHTVSHGTDGGQNEMDDYVFMFVASFVMQYTHSTLYYLLDWLCLVGFLALCLCCFRSAMCSFVRTYVRSVCPFCSLQRAPNILRRFLRIFLWFALHVCVCARVTMCIWSFSHMYVFCCYLSSFIVRRVSLSRSLTPVAQRAFAITFIRSCTHDDIIPNNSYSHIRDNIHDVCAFIFDTQHRGSSLVVVVVRFTAICIYTSRASLIRKKKIFIIHKKKRRRKTESSKERTIERIESHRSVVIPPLTPNK